MRQPSLEGCDLRLERACEHLATLHLEWSLFLDEEERRIVGHFERQTSEYVLQVSGDPPNAEIGLVVSEFAHHLRATLDNLLWQLVLLRGGTPTRVTQFPIYESWERYERNAPRLLRGVCTDDRALIEAMQPFAAIPEAPDRHPAAVIGWLNNTDKHRFLHVGCVATGAVPVEIELPVGQDEAPVRGFGLMPEDGPSNLFPWWPQPVKDVARIEDVSLSAHTTREDPTELMRVSITASGPDPQMEVKDDQAFEVAISDRERRHGLNDFDTAADFVGEVLDWFRPRFNI